jgi:hypothetical protein
MKCFLNLASYIICSINWHYQSYIYVCKQFPRLRLNVSPIKLSTKNVDISDVQSGLTLLSYIGNVIFAMEIVNLKYLKLVLKFQMHAKARTWHNSQKPVKQSIYIWSRIITLELLTAVFSQKRMQTVINRGSVFRILTIW